MPRIRKNAKPQPKFEIVNADCLEYLDTLDYESIDSFVQDPPYGLGFMGSNWDYEVPGPEFFKAQLRVAKPGAHLVAFGGTRTFHRLACAIEDAGWELRDNLCWLYGSGFPKSHNIAIAIDKQAGAMGHRGKRVTHHVGQEHMAAPAGMAPPEPITEAAKQWEGWGSALKPGHEPIILARKPLISTLADNVLDYGTGGLNIDGCRIGADGGTSKAAANVAAPKHESVTGYGDGLNGGGGKGRELDAGRWPANVILDPEAGAALDAEVGVSKSSAAAGVQRHGRSGGIMGEVGALRDGRPEGHNDSGGPSRFFYTAKSSRSEREAGLEDFGAEIVSDGRQTVNDTAYQRDATKRRNIHPTVKPVDLMRWLVRLVTPPGGLVCDPFCGSGSTGCAAMAEGFDFLGIERSAKFAAIAEARIRHWKP